MTVINNVFEIGDIVYLKTDVQHLQRIVFAIVFYKHGDITYKLTSGTTISEHYEFEITKDRAELKKEYFIPRAVSERDN